MKKKSKSLDQISLFKTESNVIVPEGYHNGLTEEFSSVVGLDLETEGLVPYDSDRNIICAAFSNSPKTCDSVWFGAKKEISDYLRWKIEQLLSDPERILVGHNLKYDLNWIRVKLGIKCKAQVFDTMFAQYLLDENRDKNSLGVLLDEYIDDEIFHSYKEAMDRSNLLNKHSPKEILVYNSKDTDGARRLFDVFVPMLEKQKLLPLMQTAGALYPILSEMETTGVLIDKEWAAETEYKLFNKQVEARLQMSEYVGGAFNPSSYADMYKVLYKQYNFEPTSFTKGGKPSTAHDAITELFKQCTVDDHRKPLLKALINYSKDRKLISTYIKPIPKWTLYDGRVHTNYNLGKDYSLGYSRGTVTGRLSSNMQQIPRDKQVKGMFKATPGYWWWSGDFSQNELRMMACLTREPAMIAAFKEGLDIHTAVMADLKNIPYNELERMLKEDAELKNERVAIKRINFGIIYGIAAPRLQRLLYVELGIDYDLEYCQFLIDQWLDRYPKVKQWIKQQHWQAINNGYVTMPLGQKRRLLDAGYHSPQGRAKLRQASNFAPQSWSSWITCIGMILLHKYYESLPYDARILLQVHDSIESEIIIPDDAYASMLEKDIKQIMEQDTIEYMKEVFGVNFDIPLEFKMERGERWQ